MAKIEKNDNDIGTTVLYLPRWYISVIKGQAGYRSVTTSELAKRAFDEYFDRNPIEMDRKRAEAQS
jgi:hypothetical protein